MIPEDFSPDVWGYCANQNEDVSASIWEKNSISSHPDLKPLSIEELTKICMDLQERIGDLEKELHGFKSKEPVFEIYYDVGAEECKAIILEELSNTSESLFPSDIAIKRGLDYDLVYRMFAELENEGKIHYSEDDE